MTEYEWTTGGSCVICGESFDGQHLVSKTTCSNRCRQKLHRYRERVDVAFDRMWEDCSFFESALAIKELREASIEQLQSIQQRINRILNKVEASEDTEYNLF